MPSVSRDSNSVSSTDPENDFDEQDVLMLNPDIELSSKSLRGSTLSLHKDLACRTNMEPLTKLCRSRAESTITFTQNPLDTAWGTKSNEISHESAVNRSTLLLPNQGSLKFLAAGGLRQPEFGA